MVQQDNRDYKHFIQDLSYVYIGARFTYQELIDEEEIPFKIKKIINQYINPELSGEDISLESHLYYMQPKGFAYQTFLQLKCKVRISILKKGKYTTTTMKLQDFVKIDPKEKENQGIMIQEIIFSKLALMTL